MRRRHIAPALVAVVLAMVACAPDEPDPQVPRGMNGDGVAGASPVDTGHTASDGESDGTLVIAG